jgi:pSer/pThr/pTyr-binding forkhead associated (FHA) protein
VNKHDNIVLRRRACLSVEAGIEEYVGFDSTNFQGTMISRTTLLATSEH